MGRVEVAIFSGKAARGTEKFVETLALILTFSPGEKEQTLSVSGIVDGPSE